MLGVSCRIVDVCRGQKWCASLLWIGSTAAVIYLAANFIGGEVLAARPAGGYSKAWPDHHLAAGTGNLVIAHPGPALPLLFVRFFHPRKIFIRL